MDGFTSCNLKHYFTIFEIFIMLTFSNSPPRFFYLLISNLKETTIRFSLGKMGTNFHKVSSKIAFFERGSMERGRWLL